MPLPESAKAKLSPWFSTEELDSFRHTERGLMSWVCRRVLKQGAITWNKVVNFAPSRYDPESKRGLALIAHEMLHVRQQRKAGWLRFLVSYVWRLRKRGHRGKNNEHHPLERPAYALQREVRRALDRDG